MWSCHIFSPNGDDLSHSAWMTFLGDTNCSESMRIFLSSAIFWAGWICPLFLSSSRTIHHAESIFNLWTVVPERSSLLYSFNPPKPTAPSTRVSFCLKLLLKLLNWKLLIFLLPSFYFLPINITGGSLNCLPCYICIPLSKKGSIWLIYLMA